MFAARIVAALFCVILASALGGPAQAQDESLPEITVGALQNGTVTVVFDNSVLPPTYLITVAWTEPGENLSYSIIIPVLRTDVFVPISTAWSNSKNRLVVTFPFCH